MVGFEVTLYGRFWVTPEVRSHYSTVKHVRLFVLGVPEGWLIALYDIRKGEWITTPGTPHDTLKEAKIAARQCAEVMIEETLPECKWR